MAVPRAFRSVRPRMLAALLLALPLALVPAAPAHAAAAPVWAITVVSQTAYSGPTGYAHFEPHCPSGQVPLTGGYSVGEGGVDVRRMAEGFHNTSGGGYWVDIYEDDAGYPPITASVWCVPSGYLSGGHLVAKSFQVQSNHIAQGDVACPSGEKALRPTVTFGGVESTVLTTYPYSGLGGWYFRGWNQDTTDSWMVASIWCVSGADFGAMRTYGATNAIGWGTAAAVDCPYGMQPIAGGTLSTDVGAISVQSRPVRTTRYFQVDGGYAAWNEGGWRSTTLSLGSGSMYTNVMCVPAALVQFTNASAGPSPNPQGTTARWTWTTTDPAAVGGYSVHQWCYVAGAGQQAVFHDNCTSPFQLTGLADNSYNLTVHAQTGDGRYSSRSMAGIVIDTTGPVVLLGDALHATHDPTVGFAVQDATNVATLTCALDGASAAPCGEGYHEGWCDVDFCIQPYYDYSGSQEVPLTGVPDGGHTLHVTATDERGNAATSHLDFRVDTTLPVVTQTAPSSRFTLGGSTTVRWAASDSGSGLAAFDVRSRSTTYNGDWTGWVQPAPLPGTATSQPYAGMTRGATYCHGVRATDTAGLTSAWTPSRCTAVPLDDRDLAGSGGWSQTSHSGWFRGTGMKTTTQGASLSVTGATVKRLAVVAWTCPTCGKVGLYVAGTRVATVDLAAGTSRRRTIMLPAFTLRDGTVSLRVLSSGKLVEIDGLGISRS